MQSDRGPSDKVEERHEDTGEIPESFARHVSAAKLKLLTNHDALTGLLNRRGLYDALSEALDEFAVWGGEPALMIVDLDGFKSFNETHGYSAGDEMLLAIAERLVEFTGGDFLLGRLGSDEFAVVMDRCESDGCEMRFAQAMIARLSEPYRVAGNEVGVTASCGVAFASTVGGDMDELINAAELAVHHAKRMGAGTALLSDSDLLQRERNRKLLITDLHRAVEERLLEVCYQPLVDMDTRTVVSFEALSRWRHETLGNISPDIFIPLAEETGLISDFGAWVLEEACGEAAAWPEPVRVSVNLSPIQFKSPLLLPTFIDVLARTGLAPGRLELEITEGAMLGGEKDNLKILDALRQLGIRIAIDDFGTGYSSLGYLQNFKFDKIKIDKRFVQDLGVDDSTTAIIQSIVSLSRTIGTRTTAEGIETEQQFRDMHALGCTEAQGYLFGPPLRAADAREFISRNLSR